jgi:hypothetical protein
MDYDRFANMDDCKSEVARLRYRIEQEYQAANLAMNGFAAGVACHQFITAKMERMGECCQQLAKLVGDREAMNIYIEATEATDAPATGTDPTAEKGAAS